MPTVFRHLLVQGGTWSDQEAAELEKLLTALVPSSVEAPAPASSPLEAVEQLRADTGEQLDAVRRDFGELRTQVEAFAQPAGEKVDAAFDQAEAIEGLRKTVADQLEAIGKRVEAVEKAASAKSSRAKPAAA